MHVQVLCRHKPTLKTTIKEEGKNLFCLINFVAFIYLLKIQVLGDSSWVCVCVSIYIYIHTRVCIYVYVYMCIYMCVCIIYIHIFITFTYTHLLFNSIYVCVWVYIYTHTIYKSIYIYIYLTQHHIIWSNFFFFLFLWPQLLHMEVPRLGSCSWVLRHSHSNIRSKHHLQPTL